MIHRVSVIPVQARRIRSAKKKEKLSPLDKALCGVLTVVIPFDLAMIVTLVFCYFALSSLDSCEVFCNEAQVGTKINASLRFVNNSCELETETHITTFKSKTSTPIPKKRSLRKFKKPYYLIDSIRYSGEESEIEEEGEKREGEIGREEFEYIDEENKNSDYKLRHPSKKNLENWIESEALARFTTDFEDEEVLFLRQQGLKRQSIFPLLRKTPLQTRKIARTREAVMDDEGVMQRITKWTPIMKKTRIVNDDLLEIFQVVTKTLKRVSPTASIRQNTFSPTTEEYTKTVATKLPKTPVMAKHIPFNLDGWIGQQVLIKINQSKDELGEFLASKLPDRNKYTQVRKNQVNSIKENWSTGAFTTPIFAKSRNIGKVESLKIPESIIEAYNAHENSILVRKEGLQDWISKMIIGRAERTSIDGELNLFKGSTKKFRTTQNKMPPKLVAVNGLENSTSAKYDTFQIKPVHQEVLTTKQDINDYIKDNEDPKSRSEWILQQLLQRFHETTEDDLVVLLRRKGLASDHFGRFVGIPATPSLNVNATTATSRNKVSSTTSIFEDFDPLEDLTESSMDLVYDKIMKSTPDDFEAFLRKKGLIGNEYKMDEEPKKEKQTRKIPHFINKININNNRSRIGQKPPSSNLFLNRNSSNQNARRMKMNEKGYELNQKYPAVNESISNLNVNEMNANLKRGKPNIGNAKMPARSRNYTILKEDTQETTESTKVIILNDEQFENLLSVENKLNKKINDDLGIYLQEKGLLGRPTNDLDTEKPPIDFETTTSIARKLTKPSRLTSTRRSRVRTSRRRLNTYQIKKPTSEDNIDEFLQTRRIVHTGFLTTVKPYEAHININRAPVSENHGLANIEKMLKIAADVSMNKTQMLGNFKEGSSGIEKFFDRLAEARNSSLGSDDSFSRMVSANKNITKELILEHLRNKSRNVEVQIERSNMEANVDNRSKILGASTGISIDKKVGRISIKDLDNNLSTIKSKIITITEQLTSRYLDKVSGRYEKGLNRTASIKFKIAEESNDDKFKTLRASLDEEDLRVPLDKSRVDRLNVPKFVEHRNKLEIIDDINKSKIVSRKSSKTSEAPHDANELVKLNKIKSSLRITTALPEYFAPFAEHLKRISQFSTTTESSLTSKNLDDNFLKRYNIENYTDNKLRQQIGNEAKILRENIAKEVILEIVKTKSKNLKTVAERSKDIVRFEASDIVKAQTKNITKEDALYLFPRVTTKRNSETSLMVEKSIGADSELFNMNSEAESTSKNMNNKSSASKIANQMLDVENLDEIEKSSLDSITEKPRFISVDKTASIVNDSFLIFKNLLYKNINQYITSATAMNTTVSPRLKPQILNQFPGNILNLPISNIAIRSGNDPILSDEDLAKFSQTPANNASGKLKKRKVIEYEIIQAWINAQAVSRYQTKNDMELFLKSKGLNLDPTEITKQMSRTRKTTYRLVPVTTARVLTTKRKHRRRKRPTIVTHPENLFIISEPYSTKVLEGEEWVGSKVVELFKTTTEDEMDAFLKNKGITKQIHEVKWTKRSTKKYRTKSTTTQKFFSTTPKTIKIPQTDMGMKAFLISQAIERESKLMSMRSRKLGFSRLSNFRQNRKFRTKIINSSTMPITTNISFIENYLESNFRNFTSSVEHVDTFQENKLSSENNASQNVFGSTKANDVYKNFTKESTTKQNNMKADSSINNFNADENHLETSARSTNNYFSIFSRNLKSGFKQFSDNSKNENNTIREVEEPITSMSGIGTRSIRTLGSFAKTEAVTEANNSGAAKKLEEQNNSGAVFASLNVTEVAKETILDAFTLQTATNIKTSNSLISYIRSSADPDGNHSLGFNIDKPEDIDPNEKEILTFTMNSSKNSSSTSNLNLVVTKISTVSLKPYISTLNNKHSNEQISDVELNAEISIENPKDLKASRNQTTHANNFKPTYFVEPILDFGSKVENLSEEDLAKSSLVRKRRKSDNQRIVSDYIQHFENKSQTVSKVFTEKLKENLPLGVDSKATFKELQPSLLNNKDLKEIIPLHIWNTEVKIDNSIRSTPGSIPTKNMNIPLFEAVISKVNSVEVFTGDITTPLPHTTSSNRNEHMLFVRNPTHHAIMNLVSTKRPKVARNKTNEKVNEIQATMKLFQRTLGTSSSPIAPKSIFHIRFQEIYDKSKLEKKSQRKYLFENISNFSQVKLDDKTVIKQFTTTIEPQNKSNFVNSKVSNYAMLPHLAISGKSLAEKLSISRLPTPERDEDYYPITKIANATNKKKQSEYVGNHFPEIKNITFLSSTTPYATFSPYILTTGENDSRYLNIFKTLPATSQFTTFLDVNMANKSKDLALKHNQIDNKGNSAKVVDIEAKTANEQKEIENLNTGFNEPNSENAIKMEEEKRSRFEELKSYIFAKYKNQNSYQSPQSQEKWFYYTPFFYPNSTLSLRYSHSTPVIRQHYPTSPLFPLNTRHYSLLSVNNSSIFPRYFSPTASHLNFKKLTNKVPSVKSTLTSRSPDFLEYLSLFNIDNYSLKNLTENPLIDPLKSRNITIGYFPITKQVTKESAQLHGKYRENLRKSFEQLLAERRYIQRTTKPIQGIRPESTKSHEIQSSNQKIHKIYNEQTNEIYFTYTMKHYRKYPTISMRNRKIIRFNKNIPIEREPLKSKLVNDLDIEDIQTTKPKIIYKYDKNDPRYLEWKSKKIIEIPHKKVFCRDEIPKTTKYTYLVAILKILYKDTLDGVKYLCSGAIISRKWVLSTSECFKIQNLPDEKLIDRTFVRAGSQFWSKNGATYKIIRIIYPPVYSREVIKSPVGLEVEYNFLNIPAMQPIAVRFGKSAFKMGRGKMLYWNADSRLNFMERKKYESVRMKMVKVYHERYCKFHASGMFCGVNIVAQDFCDYMSGALLVRKNKLYGLHVGEICEEKFSHHYFINLKHHEKWINDNILNSSTNGSTFFNF